MNGLLELSSGVSNCLARPEPWELSLNGISAIDVAAADGLADHRGGLHMNGITSLAADAAARLPCVDIELNGVRSISSATLDVLLKSDRALHLDCLQELPPKVQGTPWCAMHLSLRSVKAISVDVASALARVDSLDIGLKSLPEPVAAALASHCASLFLDALEELGEASAAHLANHEGELSFNALRHISIPAATALARMPDPIALNALEGLPTEVAVAFGSRAEHFGGVAFDGLKLLTEAVAENLGRIRHLSLSGITSLTPPVAACLVRHRQQGYFLRLLGLRELPPDVRAVLSQGRGVIEYAEGFLP